MSKIFCFVGSDHKVGTTAVVQSMGEMLADLIPNKNILLLHLDGNEGQEYTQYRGESIDRVRSLLNQNLANWEEIEPLLETYKNLSSLGGVSDVLEHQLYEVECVENLINLCKAHFDYILIDAGANVESPLSIGAIALKTPKIIITTQQSKAQQEYEKKKEAVFDKMGIAFDHVLLNRFSVAMGSFLKTEKEIANYYEMEEALLLPSIPISWQSESDHMSIYSYKDKGYRKSLQGVVEAVFFTPEELEHLGLKKRK